MARHRSHNSKYIVMVMIIIAIGYVYMNPDLLSTPGLISGSQVYSGSVDVSTTYYELKKQDDAYSVSMWADPDYTVPMIDDVVLYNDELTRDQVRKLAGGSTYTSTDSAEWTNYVIMYDGTRDKITWQHDGSSLYISDGSKYNCKTDYDISTCSMESNYNNNKVSDFTEYMEEYEEQSMPDTGLLDYLFK